MQEVLARYSEITKKMPREAILIQGQGCAWRKCTFCDYYLDVSDDPFKVNFDVINSVTGKFGMLDVIDSGSAMEIDDMSLALLISKVKEKKIHTLWFEAHWNYRFQLDKFKENFPYSVVKFRTGVETFNPELREEWNKGIPQDVKPEDIARYYDGVNLMIGLKNQTIHDIRRDIEIADKYFEYFTLNVFIPNTTNQKPNQEVINEFIEKVLPDVESNSKADILLKNTDWGVG